MHSYSTCPLFSSPCFAWNGSRLPFRPSGLEDFNFMVFNPTSGLASFAVEQPILVSNVNQPSKLLIHDTNIIEVIQRVSYTFCFCPIENCDMIAMIRWVLILGSLLLILLGQQQFCLVSKYWTLIWIQVLSLFT